jgi:hypothetical protein
MSSCYKPNSTFINTLPVSKPYAQLFSTNDDERVKNQPLDTYDHLHRNSITYESKEFPDMNSSEID